jgi:hypothetical protein
VLAARRAEREHVAALAQPAVEPLLEHRPFALRAQALAVDDAHAARAAVLAVGQEAHDGEPGLGGAHAVQVQLGVHAIGAAPQAAEHGVLDALAAELQLLADVGQRPVTHLAQRRLLVGLELQRARRRRRPVRPVAAAALQRPHAPHGVAEQRSVVGVFGVRAAGHGASGAGRGL